MKREKKESRKGSMKIGKAIILKRKKRTQTEKSEERRKAKAWRSEQGEGGVYRDGRTQN